MAGMKLAGPLAARSPGIGLALDHEIERHCSTDEILQGRLIDLVALVDVVVTRMGRDSERRLGDPRVGGRSRARSAKRIRPRNPA